MKEQFVQQKFNSASRDMIARINGILVEYQTAGYDLSLRQLYYQLVSRNIVPNTERSYKNVGDLVSNARLAGLVDWDAIKDRGREVVTNSHWDSPADILDSAARSFAIDRWADQPRWVMVMVEKQALEGVLQPVCTTWDVPFSANKGYGSSSMFYELGKRIQGVLNDDREAVVIYLGDHDPSGIDMTRDVEERLAMFSEGEVRVERNALNMPQIRALNPPENPAKLTDSRADSYVKKFGYKSWELDAIEPRRLAALVTDAISAELDQNLWYEAVEREAAMRSDLKRMAREYRMKSE